MIQFEGVGKVYGNHWLYRHLDQSFEAGRVYAVTGPNGVGKSVLLKLCCALIRPNEGRVVIDPSLLRKREYPDWFGVLINGPAYLAGASALDNLRELAQIRRRASEGRIREVLAEVGLDPSDRRRVARYSTGMKQKLGLAQAFLEYPRVVLLDEPFNALDTESAERLTSMIKRMRNEGGLVIFASHSRDDVTNLADEEVALAPQ